MRISLGRSGSTPSSSLPILTHTASSTETWNGDESTTAWATLSAVQVVFKLLIDSI